MKIYAVIIADYDLYGEYGFYVKKSDAEKRLQKLKNDPKFLWKEYLEIREKTLTVPAIKTKEKDNEA